VSVVRPKGGLAPKRARRTGSWGGLQRAQWSVTLVVHIFSFVDVQTESIFLLLALLRALAARHRMSARCENAVTGNVPRFGASLRQVRATIVLVGVSNFVVANAPR